LPQHSLLITDEDETALAAYLADDSCRLFMLDMEQSRAAGFALFCDLHNRAGAIELRRLALRDVGKGKGRAFVQLLTDYAFERLGAQRVWLDTNFDNVRAQAVYSVVGYQLEGKLRAHGYCAPLARAIDQWIYGILRDEWQALRS
jgi:RimJ/RimL family protein N-acetyltransferase